MNNTNNMSYGNRNFTILTKTIKYITNLSTTHTFYL